MSRTTLYALLNTIYPTYGVGQNTSDFENPYLVVKYNTNKVFK